MRFWGDFTCPISALIVQVTHSLVLLRTNWTDNLPLHTLVVEASRDPICSVLPPSLLR